MDSSEVHEKMEEEGDDDDITLKMPEGVDAPKSYHSSDIQALPHQLQTHLVLQMYILSDLN